MTQRTKVCNCLRLLLAAASVLSAVACGERSLTTAPATERSKIDGLPLDANRLAELRDVGEGCALSAAHGDSRRGFAVPRARLPFLVAPIVPDRGGKTRPGRVVQLTVVASDSTKAQFSCWFPIAATSGGLTSAVAHSKPDMWKELFAALPRARQIPTKELALTREMREVTLEYLGPDKSGLVSQVNCGDDEMLRALHSDSTVPVAQSSSTGKAALEGDCNCYAWDVSVTFNGDTWSITVSFYFCSGTQSNDYGWMIENHYWQFPCGGSQPDDRDYIIPSYEDPELVDPSPTAYGDFAWRPGCHEFSTTARSVYFTHNELSQGNGTTWAILKPTLVAPASSGSGADAWREAYGDSRTATSGYRTPHHNRQIGGTRGSRHMFGDALDLYNESCNGDPNCQQTQATLAEWQAMYLAAEQANAGFRELLDSSMGPCPCSGIKHVHADWRVPANQ